MPICADQRDYRDAFRKHYSTYIRYKETGSHISCRLILVYSVECGLKYMLMRRERIFRVTDAQESIQKFLASHDFYRLLRALNQAGNYSFPPIKTVHNDIVRADTYHQLCRYAIRTDNQKLIEQYDDQLQQIADWLGEHVL